MLWEVSVNCAQFRSASSMRGDADSGRSGHTAVPSVWVSSEGGRYTQDSLQGEVWLSKPPQQNKTVFPKSRNSQISTVPLSPLRVVFRFLSSPCAGSGREQPAGASVHRPAGGGRASRRKRVSAKASGVGGRPLDTRTIESEARSDLRSVSP